MRSLNPGENKRAVFVLAHAGAWLLYGGFIFIANYLANPNLRITQTIFFLAPHCLTFYISIYFLGLYARRGVTWSIASFFLVFLLMGLLSYGYIYIVLPLAGIKVFGSDNLHDFLKALVLGYVQYFSYALLYFYVTRFLKKERELAQIREEKLLKELENAKLREQEMQSEQEKLLLEFAFLRSQVNPHFLHNTLNVLFSQALDHSQELADNISRLSRMMRYAMESTAEGMERVPVARELDNLRLLMEINQTRFRDALPVHFSIDGEIDNQQVPPLALITIMENALKYGDLKDPDHPVTVRVLLRPGSVCFYCSNRKKKISNQAMGTGDEGGHLGIGRSGIGLRNLVKRLELSFKDCYSINVSDSNAIYSIRLFIKNG